MKLLYKFKNMSAEEKLIIVFLFLLILLFIPLYYYPERFFNIYDKIYFFLIS